MTALREIRILQLLNHDNIVSLIEICRTKGTRLLGHTPISPDILSDVTYINWDIAS